MKRCLLTGLLLIAGMLFSPRAEEVVLTAVADTSLWQRQTNHNLGGTPFLPGGTVGSDGNFSRTRLLLKFDLQGAVPPNAVITAASIKLRVVRAPEKVIRNSTFAGRRILKDWGEGNKTFLDFQTPMTSTQVATAGEATWDLRFAGDPSSAWAERGGDFTDNDFAEAVDFSFFTSSAADVDVVAGLNGEGLNNIRSWLASPASNYGWVIKTELETGEGTARQIASREYFDPQHRPQLTITYTVPGPVAPEITGYSLSGNLLTIDYTAQAGVVYRPQFKNSLSDSGWTDLADQGPLGIDGVLQFSNDLTGVPTRYFQVASPNP